MKASRFWSKQIPVFYVANIKPSLIKRGAKGDWGYTTKSNEAIDLTPYQAKHFNSDCKQVGVVARFS